jgi:hypothetical protein
MIGKIYRLDGGDKFYIGSTTGDLKTRLKKHKCKSNEQISKSRKVYTYFKEIGWNNVTIRLIKDIEVTNRQELLSFEKEELLKVKNNLNCLNTALPITTVEEKKKRDADYGKKRRQENPERERERLQKWRKENPEKRKAQILREHNKKESTFNLK